MIYNSIEFHKKVKLISISPYISNTNIKRSLLNNRAGQVSLEEFLEQYHTNNFEVEALSKYKENIYKSLYLFEGFFISGLTKNVFSESVTYPAKEFIIESGYPVDKNNMEKKVLNYSNSCDENSKSICNLLLENNFYRWIELYSYNLISSVKFRDLRDIKLELTNYLIDHQYDFDINKEDVSENYRNDSINHLPISVLFKNRPDLKIVDFLGKSFNYGVYNIKHLLIFSDDFLNFIQSSNLNDYETIEEIFKLH